MLISYICGIVSVELKLLQVVCKIISGRGVRGAMRFRAIFSTTLGGEV